MDNQRIENAQMNTKCFISNGLLVNILIISDHGESKELDGDCVISGLVYRLMNPMSDQEMYAFALNKANDIMNGDGLILIMTLKMKKNF